MELHKVIALISYINCQGVYMSEILWQTKDGKYHLNSVSAFTHPNKQFNYEEEFESMDDAREYIKTELEMFDDFMIRYVG